MDCIKGAACIAVVLIHYNFPGYLGIIIKTLSRFAVPFFFGVSGYYCETKPSE
uniref:acyltransferase family protein n=1 Tax=Enterocloster clostridioformis TaxID=1531 RepID=UPI003FA49461